MARNYFILVAGLAVAVLLATALFAQDAPQGDRRRGENQDSGSGDNARGGRGGSRGMGRGGGGFGGGGGYGGNFDPAERLRRYDTNGNGQLEPNEIPDRARPFIERLAQQAGVDVNAPMPIDRLSAAMDPSRRDRREPQEQSQPGEPATTRNGQTPSTSTGATAAKASVERLVPGFGEQVDLPSVPGFGVSVAAVAKSAPSTNSTTKSDVSKSDGADDDYNGPLLGKSSNAKTTQPSAAGSGRQKVLRYLSPAERLPEGLPGWFIRADIDGDGQVSMSEFATEWSEGEVARFAKYDLNGDGVITPEECLQVEKPAKK